MGKITSQSIENENVMKRKMEIPKTKPAVPHGVSIFGNIVRISVPEELKEELTDRVNEWKQDKMDKYRRFVEAEEGA